MKKLLAVTALIVSVIVPTQATHAQTVFAWPEDTVNLSAYRYLDNCVAVGTRVWDSVRSAQKILSDTVFSFRGLRGEIAPAKVQTSLQECLSNFTPTQIPREYAQLAQRAYLHAGRFAEADAVVNHGLSQLPATDTASRTALLDSVIGNLATNPPYQLRQMQAYIDTLERYGSAYRRWSLFRNYFLLMHSAYMTNEDSLALRAGERMLALAPEAMKGASPPEIAAVGIGVRGALRMTRGKELLDSLRKGTAAFATLYTEQFRKSMGFVPPSQSRDVEAAVLQGDYWFPAAAATQEYPRKGRVSILVFVPDRVSGGNGPTILLSQLRRLTKKYSTVDLVFVTATVGNFGVLEPPPSEREAFLSDSVFRSFHLLNPVTTVTKGTFVQFDAPDNRRFYQPTPNMDAYPPPAVDFYRDSKYMQFILVDEQRRIVDMVSPNDEEGWTMQLLETLLARAAGGPQR